MAQEKPETAGSRLRVAVLEKFDLDPAELLLLDRAAAIADTLARIDRAVARAALVTGGSTGQRVAEPLLKEQREHTGRLESLLAALALPRRDEITGKSAISLAAQRAASIRWARVKGGGNGAVA